MLSMVDLTPGRASYYLGKQDYYLGKGDQREAPGWWTGRGSAACGLTGPVQDRDFRLLYQGFGPKGEKLVQNAGQKNHFPGVEFCCSCPKTWSSAWATADPELRRRMEEKAAKAVEATVRYMEDFAAQSRTGKGGKDREPVQLVCAVFPHGSSRAQDPNLHYHVCVLNVGVSKLDGKTRSLVCEEPYRHKMAAGAVFRAELARGAMELGFELYRPVEERGKFREEKSWWELKGVPSSLTDEWSKRAKEIAREAKAYGLETAKGKELATLATRKAKETAPRKELFEAWGKTARSHGFTPEIIRGVLVGKPRELDPEEELRGAVRIALERVTDKKSHFAMRDLVEQVAVEAQGRGLGYARIIQGVKDTLQNSSEVVRLGTVKGETRFTTREMLAVEAKLLTQVEASRGKAAHVLRAESVEAAIAAAEKKLAAKVQGNGEPPPTLSDEQKRAIYHVAQGTDSVSVVTGWAGAGKSPVQAALRHAYELEGYRVLGCALAKKAALNQEQEAGIKSTSIAKLLYDVDLGILDEAKHHIRQAGRAALGKKTYPYEPLRIDAKTVVMVDEAGMVGTRQMQKLVERVLERGGKVCLVGDAKQLQPVDAGGPFRAVAGVVGQAELTQIIRQKEEWHREAVKDFARGRGKEALEAFASRGQVSVARNRNAAMDRLIADWRQAGGTTDPAKCLIVCATNEERAALNWRAQEAMREAGKLSKRKVAVRGSEFHEGDRIVFTQNNKYLGVENGSTGHIVRIGRKRVTRTTFHGKQFRSVSAMARYAEKVAQDKAVCLTVRLDGGKLVEVDLGRYDSFRLSYCLNTHHAQGQTVEKALLLTGGAMTSRELVYVQASRSRSETRLYTDRYSAGEGLEELAKSASKSKAKDLAHDLLRERAREPELGR